MYIDQAKHYDLIWCLLSNKLVWTVIAFIHSNIKDHGQHGQATPILLCCNSLNTTSLAQLKLITDFSVLLSFTATLSPTQPTETISIKSQTGFLQLWTNQI